MTSSSPDPGAIYEGGEGMAETLALEQRLLDAGYGGLIAVFDETSDFPYEGNTIEEVITEARAYLLHQWMCDEAGARLLAKIGEVAVKAQAFDAIVGIVDHRSTKSD